MTISMTGLKGKDFIIDSNDSPAMKMAMLIEGHCTIGVQAACQKYDYTEQRYYQLLNNYQQEGSKALIDKKRGSDKKPVRTELVINQIIRLRFLDPVASCDVLAQKLKQLGYDVSKRSVERTITEYGLKKTHCLNPQKQKQKQEVNIQFSKRETKTVRINNDDSERRFRESLSRTIIGTSVGLWFLIASYLKLGVWDLIKSFTGCSDKDIDAHIAMQIVNEAALCSNRIRKSNYLANQGFEITNGLGFLASDKQVHIFLDKHTVCQSEQMQMELAAIRKNAGHYQGHTIAFDPHRIITTSRRIMPKKKKQPEEPSRKMLQTFFAADADTGQPIGFGIGSSGVNTTKASIALFELIEVVNKSALIIADKEHFTQRLIETTKHDTDFDLLVPAINNPRVNKIHQKHEYQPLWAGYAMAETDFSFANAGSAFRMLIQREGETQQDYAYKSFITLKNKPAKELLTEKYSQRWSIEDFFNFDGAMGFDRASTLNLNIRYAKMSLALIAQAATYQFRQQLPQPYKRWNAEHLSDAILGGIDGDIRVNGDTIIVTCYNAPKEYELHKYFVNFPEKLSAQGINPHIPWLYDYKIDFRFK